jgi:chromosome segregation ATPase
MKNESTHILKIGGDISELKKTFSEAGKMFDNLYKNGAPPKELIAAYNKVIKMLDALEAKTKEGVFKGTEVEYSGILRLFDSIGTEFETLNRVIEQIGGMDNDTLSKFLTKEDAQTYIKTNAALKEFYGLIKKINSEKSSTYTNAENKLVKAEDKKSEAEAKKKQRNERLQEAAEAIKPVQDAREKTKLEKQNLDKSQDELTIAKSTEKTKKASMEAIQGELDALDAQIEQEKAILSNELQELKNAKANFTKIKKFYESTDENGQTRDVN